MYRYSIYEYGLMMSDNVRVDAYLRAMRESITPNSVVLDLGSGPGFFALLACRLGARRVFAIEPSNSILLGRELAEQNGCSDRIEFFHAAAENVTLPERVTVLVHDLRGTLPIGEDQLRVLVDARRRFLAPGATLIGYADTLWAAVVECPAVYRPYAQNGDYGGINLELSAYRRRACNDLHKARFRPQELLSAPSCWARLEYAVIESAIVDGQIESEILRTGIAHGIAVWFDAELAPGIGFSNAPGQPDTVYASLFFPWLEPVPVEKGDRVSITLRAVPSGPNQVWIWNCRVEGRGGTVKAEFNQSSLFAEIMNPTQLHRTALDYRPELNHDGEINQFILDLMSGELTVGEIADRARARFPQTFHTISDALNRVGALAHEYSR